MAYRLRVGLSKVKGAIVAVAERVLRRPLSKASKKKIAMSATRRETFVWTIVRGQEVQEKDEIPELFVRVNDDVPEVTEEFHEEPVVEKVYSTPSYTTATQTSSGAMMYEFPAKDYNFDSLDMQESEERTFETEVIEAPVFKEYVETEEERQFYEGLYEDLTVEAVLEYMDTIELEPKHAPDYVISEIESLEECETCIEIEASEIAGYIEAPVSEIAGYIGAPSAVSGYIGAPESNIAGYIEAPVSTEHAETEEEKQFYESLYEDLTVKAVLEYIDTIELEPKHAPDYIISEIESLEKCETCIEIELPEPEPAPMSILAQFVFGFDAPVSARPGKTKFRFIVGSEEDNEDDTESVQVISYSGDAAVSASSISGGQLAL